MRTNIYSDFIKQVCHVIFPLVRSTRVFFRQQGFFNDDLVEFRLKRIMKIIPLKLSYDIISILYLQSCLIEFRSFHLCVLQKLHQCIHHCFIIRLCHDHLLDKGEVILEQQDESTLILKTTNKTPLQKYQQVFVIHT